MRQGAYHKQQFHSKQPLYYRIFFSFLLIIIDKMSLSLFTITQAMCLMGTNC